MLELPKTREDQLMAGALIATLLSVPLSILGTISMVNSPLFEKAMDEVTGSGPILVFAIPVLWFFGACGFFAMLWILWALRVRIQSMRRAGVLLLASVLTLLCVPIGLFLCFDLLLNIYEQFWVQVCCDGMTLAAVACGVLFTFSLASRRH